MKEETEMAGGYFLAGPAEDLPPGSMRCQVVNGKRLLLANVGGLYLAADESCTHEDASLCKGNLHESFVTCPLHGSRFDLRTGKAMEEPAESDLRTYPVEVRDGFLYVRIT